MLIFLSVKDLHAVSLYVAKPGMTGVADAAEVAKPLYML